MDRLLHISPAVTIPSSELHFRFSRSGGVGGQNVNKVSTRVELVFNLRDSPSLTQAQKERVTGRLGKVIGAEGTIVLSSQESRSQWQNRQLVTGRFVELLRRSLKVVRPRVATKASHVSHERRLKKKTLHSRKKELRRRVDA